MSLLNKFLAFNAGTKKKIFRREVETALRYGKQIKLPSLPSYNQQQLQVLKDSFPFPVLSSASEKELIKKFSKEEGSDATILVEAEKVLQHRVTFFGVEEKMLGEKVRWDYDYLSSFAFPNEPYWNISVEDFPKGVDVQTAWELGRMHQLSTLGAAYLITSDEKYSEKYFSLVDDFILSTANFTGVQWANPSEAAIRLINIIFGFGFFLESPLLNEQRFLRIQETVLLHSLFLEHTIEYSEVRDHRYVLVHLGLLCASMFIQNKAYAERLFHFSASQFEQEIRRQVFEDGVSFEQSVQLHPLNTELFLLAKYFLERKGKKVSDEYNRRLHEMLFVLNQYKRSTSQNEKNNSLPNIGDAFTSPIIDFSSSDQSRYIDELLSVGAYLFNDEKLKLPEAAGSTYLLFLFGAEATRSFQSMKSNAERSSSFGLTKGGHYLFRTKETDMFIRASEIGKSGSGAPGHNDTFTFELLYKNKLFFVDSGTYSFYADKDLRNKLRSVFSHNTFSIDNTQLADFNGLFNIKEDLTKPKIIEWQTDNEEDILVAQHFAYVRLSDPVICKRGFYFLKEKKKIKIKDEFLGGKKHKIVSHLHLHHEVEIEKIEPNKYLLKNGEAKLQICFHSSSENFETYLQDSVYSPGYRVLHHAKKIHTVLHEILPTFYIIEIDLL
ncbi:MAG: heparinase II/III family protein [Ignavibacteriaceae bacterium]|nr:heparinase II/III family protein [Ignavibacteriaceae bacterium]